MARHGRSFTHSPQTARGPLASPIIAVDATMTGTGTVTAVGSAQALADATLAGTGALSGSANATALTTLTSAGTGALSPTGASVLPTDATAAGTGTVSGQSQTVGAEALSATGTGAVTGEAQATVAVTGNASGAATVTLEGGAFIAATATAGGTSTVSGQIEDIGSGTVLTSAGIGAASFAGVWLVQATVAAAGAGTFAADGQDIGVPPPTINYQGDGKSRRRRKKRREFDRLMDEIERTVRDAFRKPLAPQPILPPIPEAPVATTAKERQSTDYRAVAARIGQVKRDVAAYHAKRLHALIEDDEEVMMLV